MVNGDISDLMNFWAADVLADGREPPFADYNDMLNTIDSSIRVTFLGNRSKSAIQEKFPRIILLAG